MSIPDLRLFEGDMLDVLATIPACTYTSVVTDPPYGLSAPPDPYEVLVQWILSGEFHRVGGRTRKPPAGLSELAERFKRSAGPGGFMGQKWDTFVPGPKHWAAVGRVCRPGAIALVFAGARTQHWMAISLMLAGFEILDTIGWVNAEGMAKSGTIDRRIDARLGATRPMIGKHPAPSRNRPGTAAPIGPVAATDVALTAPGSPEAMRFEGYSTQLGPGIEPVIVARWPCEGTATANILRHGCGALNVGACLISGESTRRENRVDMGYGGGLVAAGTGYSTGSEAGRWPKNVMLDEICAALLDAQVGDRTSGSRAAGVRSGMGYHGAAGDGGPAIRGSSGGPSRFFWTGPCATEDDVLLPVRYCAKASDPDRNAGLPFRPDTSLLQLVLEGYERTVRRLVSSTHTTVKPGELMRWLLRLVAVPDGRTLDPFAGSGTTLRAATAEGVACDGVEREPQYARLARLRAQLATAADTQWFAERAALVSRANVMGGEMWHRGLVLPPRLQARLADASALVAELEHRDMWRALPAWCREVADRIAVETAASEEAA